MCYRFTPNGLKLQLRDFDGLELRISSNLSQRRCWHQSKARSPEFSLAIRKAHFSVAEYLDLTYFPALFVQFGV